MSTSTPPPRTARSIQAISLLLSFGLAAAVPHAHAQDLRYPPLSGIDVEWVSSGSFEPPGDPIRYHYYAVRGQQHADPAFVQASLESAARSIAMFAYPESPTRVACRPGDLIIFEVPYAVLNDHSRFFEWPHTNGIDITTPIISLYGNWHAAGSLQAEIVLAHEGEFRMRIMIAHELAHALYDRYCWERPGETPSEDFALAYQHWAFPY